MRGRRRVVHDARVNAGAWLTILSLGALLVSASRASRAGEWVFKPLSSAGFVLSALEHGAARGAYGAGVLAALACSMLGDVLLIPRTRRTFLLGLGAFLLGHVAYAAAFVARGVAWTVALAAGAALLAPLAMVGRALLPRVPAGMKLPVMAYMAVITAMVALAFGTVSLRGDARVLVGAVAFYLSDLSVARDRFVAPGFANKLWGWPLYFGAQLVFAATVGP